MEVDIVESTLCNMCGEQLIVNDFGYTEDYLSIQKTWGFGSEMDGQTHNIDLCINCYKKFISEFRISALSAKPD